MSLYRVWPGRSFFKSIKMSVVQPQSAMKPESPQFVRSKDSVLGYPIETARACAVFLLVSYHVIGVGSYGLDVAYPHPLRYYADFLVDLRMPMFAFIAGAVYALKPVDPAQLRAFLVGKLRRLAVPGLIAMLIFMLATQLADTKFSAGPSILTAVLYSYAHFWFLHVILAIFFLYVPLDIMTRGRSLGPALSVAIAAQAAGLSIPTQIFALNRLEVLLPYFLFGAFFIRHRQQISNNRAVAGAAAGLALFVGAGLSIEEFARTGQFSTDRTDFQTIFFGFGACALAMLYLPRVDAFGRLGPYAFTIYLYHVFGTSGMRRILGNAGVQDVWVNFVFGTAAGILVPVLLHLAAAQFSLTRRLLLGQRA